MSLSKDNFFRMVERWDNPGREAKPPSFGWLSTELNLYTPPTVNPKTNLHTRPLGERPLTELEPTAHPLSVERRTGIARSRVQELSELLMHPL